MAENGEGSLQGQIDEAKRHVTEVEQARETCLAKYDKKIEAAKASCQELVKCAEQEVAKAEEPYNGLVDQLGSVTLYGNRVVVSDKTIKLVPDIEVGVSTSGNTYSETRVSGGGPDLGGAVVGGLIAGTAGAVVGGQKPVTSQTTTHDTRKIFLTIVTEEGSAVAELDSSKELEVRELAGKIRSLAKSAEKRRLAVADAVAEAQQRLKEVRADTAAIDEAEKDKANFEANTSALDEAKQELARVTASIDPEALQAEKDAAEAAKRAERKKERKAQLRILGIALFLIVGLALIASGIDCWTRPPQNAVGGTILLLLADALIVAAVGLFLAPKRQAKEA